ncbi:hypothetical protein WMF31_20850 [Sorangium sp. So ce1036]|uniref:hypothetical protein n=1 Tax=Sorangium sp. So ce1036 TaxID=3133328 RepID=UPI003F120BF5
MEHSPRLAVFVLAVAALFAGGCVAPFDPGEEDAGDAASQAVRSDNALTSNALTSNALTSNALTSNALTSNALTAGALARNPLTASALRDPAARSVLKYIAGCALPAGERILLEIDGVEVAFVGELGLAPRWGEKGGSCDAGCRSWVSGCVLARLNYLGEKVSISLRGDHEELRANKAERRAYPRQEATYYGDIFAEEPLYYACLPPGASSIPRVCGPSLDGCVLDVVGPCGAVCEKQRDDGSFPGCRAMVRGRSGELRPDEPPYPGSLSVFLEER